MIDDDETFPTPDAAVEAAMTRLIEEFGVYGRDLGASEERIARIQAKLQQVLHARREAMRAMLEARATNLH
jgi:hypothetical protein